MKTTVKKGRILFVDDEPNILNTMRWLFQREYEVVTAQGGREAIAMLSQSRFDVVVSDQRMPEVSGIDVLREARKRSPRTMRILLTGYADMEATVNSVNEGEVFRYVTKPWDNNDFKVTVQMAVEASQVCLQEQAVDNTPATQQVLEAHEHILVLDDTQKTAAEIQGILGNSGTVHYANNADAALDILENNEVGVVVSDTILGGVSVTPLLSMLKEHHPYIVTIVFTAQRDAYLVMDLINKGQIFRFLSKPIHQGQYRLSLISAIKKHHEMLKNPLMARRHRVDRKSSNRSEFSQQPSLVEKLFSRVRSLPNRLFASA